MVSVTPTFSQVIPSAYGYVLAAAASSGFVLVWQSVLVGGARKAAKIPYPQLYATPEQQQASKEALIFNCTQRSHQNTLESYSLVIFGSLVTGLQYPRFAATACATWVLGRVLYTVGYRTGTPAKRNYGAVGSLAAISLVFSTTYTAYRVIVDGLV